MWIITQFQASQLGLGTQWDGSQISFILEVT
jgi:hypothetical protein